MIKSRRRKLEGIPSDVFGLEVHGRQEGPHRMVMELLKTSVPLDLKRSSLVCGQDSDLELGLGAPTR